MGEDGEDGTPPTGEAPKGRTARDDTAAQPRAGLNAGELADPARTLVKALRNQAFIHDQLPSSYSLRLMKDHLRYAEMNDLARRILDAQIPENFFSGHAAEHLDQMARLATSGMFADITKWSLSPTVRRLLSTASSTMFQDALRTSWRFQDLTGTSIARIVDDAAMSGLLHQASSTSMAFESAAQSLLQAEGTRLVEMRDALSLPTLAFQESALAIDQLAPGLEPRPADRPVAAEHEPSCDPELETALARMGPGFVASYRGTYHAKETGSPDAWRQAATSARELVRELLVELAPDDRFSPKEIKAQGHKGRPTRRMRVHRIVGDSMGPHGPKLVDRLAGLTTVLYDYTADVTHTGRQVPLDHLISLLEAYLTHLLWQAGLLEE